MFGQTAKFGQRSCLFHTSIIGIRNKLTKQTVNILMRRLIRSRLIWIYTVCKCVSEFTWCPNLPAFSLPIIFTLVDFPKHTNAVSMEKSILYFEGPQVEISKDNYFLVPEYCFFYLNQTVQTLMNVAFHIGLNSLPKYPFTGIQNENGINLIRPKD